MNEQSYHYQKIALAIEYLQTHFKDQPDLDELAEKVHLSPFHFQRMFTEWVGVSPKKFLQYISISHAKNMLKVPRSTLFDVADDTGLSGTGRLHDLFVNIEGMTPGEYKNGGEDLHIEYSYSGSPFGSLLIASTLKGICHLAFIENKKEALSDLIKRFPKANFRELSNQTHQQIATVFDTDYSKIQQIKLHLKGTDFQLKVWEALLKIPIGRLSSYGQIAKEIAHPNASRAVGTAIGSNPIAYLIPCHRVIQSGGLMGGYMWGTTRKTAIIGWESARLNFPETLKK